MIGTSEAHEEPKIVKKILWVEPGGKKKKKASKKMESDVGHQR